MPITFSHPAAAVPFQKIGIPLSALIMGSMAPDFEFFLKLSDGKAFGHTTLGVLLFCLPVSLVALAIFHYVLKFPLISLLPHSHQVKILPVARQFSFWPFSQFVKIVIGIVIGAVTHLGWDSLTHPGTWIVEQLSFLSAPMFTLSYGTVRVYFFLQYLTSALAVVLMGFWYFRWFKGAPIGRYRTKHRAPKKTKIAIAVGLCCMGVGLGFIYGLASSLHLIDKIQMLRSMIAHTAIASVSGFGISLTAFCLVWRIMGRHHHHAVHDEEPREGLSKASLAKKQEPAQAS